MIHGNPMGKLLQLRDEGGFHEAIEEVFDRIYEEAGAPALGGWPDREDLAKEVCAAVDSLLSASPSLEQEVTESLTEAIEKESLRDAELPLRVDSDFLGLGGNRGVPLRWKALLHPMLESEEWKEQLQAEAWPVLGAEEVWERLEASSDGRLKELVDWLEEALRSILDTYWSFPILPVDPRKRAREYVERLAEKVQEALDRVENAHGVTLDPIWTDEDQDWAPAQVLGAEPGVTVQQSEAPTRPLSQSSQRRLSYEMRNRSGPSEMAMELGAPELNLRLGKAEEAFIYPDNSSLLSSRHRIPLLLREPPRVISWIPVRIWEKALRLAFSDSDAVERPEMLLEQVFDREANSAGGCLVATTKDDEIEKPVLAPFVADEGWTQYLVPRWDALQEEASDFMGQVAEDIFDESYALSDEQARARAEFLGKARANFFDYLSENAPDLLRRIRKAKLPPDVLDSYVHTFISSDTRDNGLALLSEAFGDFGYVGTRGQVIAEISKKELLQCGFEKGQKMVDLSPFKLISLPDNELAFESVLMRHCVGKPEFGYREAVASGDSEIWSLRTRTNRPIMTWEVNIGEARDGRTGASYVRQVRGKANRGIPNSEEEARLVAMLFVKAVSATRTGADLTWRDLLGGEAAIQSDISSSPSFGGALNWSFVPGGDYAHALLWNDLVVEAVECLGLEVKKR